MLFNLNIISSESLFSSFPTNTGKVHEHFVLILSLDVTNTFTKFLFLSKNALYGISIVYDLNSFELIIIFSEEYILSLPSSSVNIISTVKLESITVFKIVYSNFIF